MERLSQGTQELKPLILHDTVQVQNQVGNHPSRWDITGVIVETRPFDQYVVKIHGSGRLTTRNRKFLKKIKPYCPAPRPAIVPLKPDSEESQPKILEPAVIILESQSESENEHSNDTTRNPDATANPEPELRRSTRTRNQPDRLQVHSWKGQSYEQSSSSERPVPDVTA